MKAPGLSRLCSRLSIHTAPEATQRPASERVTPNDGTNALKARGVLHSVAEAIQSTVWNSETFSAHLSVLKAATAISILFMYLHLNSKAVSAPYEIQIIQWVF